MQKTEFAIIFFWLKRPVFGSFLPFFRIKMDPKQTLTEDYLEVRLKFGNGGKLRKNIPDLFLKRFVSMNFNLFKHLGLIIFCAGDKGEPDCCIFDFTNLYAARVAARVTVAILFLH